jgi:NAD(P)-dependent dehydrogenase (short-subunit alcohol dehydrogenase family)
MAMGVALGSGGNMRGLTGRGVLISGGSSGIGLAAAQRFLEEGCRVFLCGIDAVEVDRAVAGLREHGQVAGTACDVSQEDGAARLAEAAHDALGGVDVLANNAGIAMRSPFLDIPAAQWDRVVAVNLRGMFLVAQAVGRRMAERGAGVIVNMSSTNGIAGEVDYAHYNATKAGVLLLTKTMAVELGPLGIRVNALCPGYISTPLNAAIAAGLDADFERDYARTRIPLRRPGTAQEVAAAYAFLASEDASFIHGTGLVIDGGQLAVM